MSDDKGNKDNQDQPTQQSGTGQQGGIGNIGSANNSNINTGSGRQIGSVQGDYNENSGSGTQNNIRGTQNNVTGTQNNVGRDQFNSGRDQFIGNRNVSTGSGGIEDYGGVQGGVHNYSGVQGGVNSGSGSQSNIHAGDISGNSGNVAVGNGINQSNSSGGQNADPKVNALLLALEDLRDSVDELTGDERKSVREPLTAAIKSLRSGQLDANAVSKSLQLVSDALADADRGKERTTLKSAAAAAGLNIR